MKLSIKFISLISILLIAIIAVFLFLAVSKTPSTKVPETQRNVESQLEPDGFLSSDLNKPKISESPILASTAHEMTPAPPMLEESESAAMISWKQSAGISTRDKIEFYIGKSREELMQLVQQGDLEAKTWLGVRMARSGEQDAAVAVLKDAVTDGSIGAARTLAQLYSGNTSRNFPPNRIQSYAWYRLAQVMGDAGPMLLGQIPRNFSSEEQYYAELAYFDLLTEVHALYELKHGQPMPFNPPPIEEREKNE